MPVILSDAKDLGIYSERKTVMLRSAQHDSSAFDPPACRESGLPARAGPQLPIADLHPSINPTVRMTGMIPEFAKRALSLLAVCGNLAVGAHAAAPQQVSPGKSTGSAAEEAEPLLSKAFQQLYLPGSTFKLITASAAFENGFRPDSTVKKET